MINPYMDPAAQQTLSVLGPQATTPTAAGNATPYAQALAKQLAPMNNGPPPTIAPAAPPASPLLPGQINSAGAAESPGGLALTPVGKLGAQPGMQQFSMQNMPSNPMYGTTNAGSGPVFMGNLPIPQDAQTPAPVPAATPVAGSR